MVLTASLTAPPLAEVPLDPLVLRRNGSVIEVFADFPRFAVGEERMVAWIDVAVTGVHAYLGKMPVPRLHLYIDDFEGAGIRHGRAFGVPMPHIRLSVGDETPGDFFHRDWKLTHELIHMAVPRLDRHQSWLDEGLATYVEPLARFKAGNLTEEQAWKWLVEGLPHALTPEANGGLDRTRSWGTVYWGGALFCLLADIDLRQATGNRKGLRHALAVLVKQGHNIEERGEVGPLLVEADAALGVDVLAPLYRKWRTAPFQVDMQALWRRLGVVAGDQGDIRFDDQSELAAIRRSITRD